MTLAWKLLWRGNYLGVEITIVRKLPWRGNNLGAEITLTWKLPLAWKLPQHGNDKSVEIIFENLTLVQTWCGKGICVKLTMAWNSFGIINK